MLNEKINILYRHKTDYLNTALNAIGATTSMTLRTVATHNDTNCKYVRKFGADYEITEVTDIEDPVDVHLTLTVKAADGTTLGSRTGGGAFVAGSTVTAQGCYIVASASGGVGTLPADIDITTDVDSPLTVVLTGEDIADGDSMTFYVSSTGSTYYDSEMMYGGGRHTPDGTAQFPYFTITAALAALGAGFTIVTVLDSRTYDEELTISGAYTLQAALGCTPTITRGVGARITREVSAQWNNTTACYFNTNGSDVTGDGTWQQPLKTLTAAETGRGALTAIVYGGTGCMSDTIDEDYVFDFDGTFEPDYGYMLYYTGGLTLSFFHLHGIYFKSNTIGTHLIYSGADEICFEDCTFDSLVQAGIRITENGVDESELFVYRCLFKNNTNAGIDTYGVINSHCQITAEYNIFQDNLYHIKLNAATSTYTVLSIKNNSFLNGDYGTYMYNAAPSAIGAMTIQNNLFFKCIHAGAQVKTSASATVENNIFYYCGSGFLPDDAVTIDYNNFYGNTTKYNANVTSNNESTADPKPCSATGYKIGLNSESSLRGTDKNSDDFGPHFRILNIAANDSVVNGFNFDGQESYHEAVFTIATMTGALIGWNFVYDFQGCGINLFGSADSNATIKNNLFHSNGDGIGLKYGGNTVEECIIESSAMFGLSCDYGTQIVNHLILYNNYYGASITANSDGVNFKNSIINGNSLYGIYSAVSMSISYCCITDGVNNNVNISDTSNLDDNPLFVNTNPDEEDFHLKTVEGGYKQNSLCKDRADDGYDVGAYLIERSIDEDSWRAYQLAHNPRNIDFQIQDKGPVKFENIIGQLDNFVKDHKRAFIFKWGGAQYSTEELRNKISYFATLVKSRVNGLTDEEVKFRIQFLPAQGLETGALATISATGKTIIDTTKQWTEDQHKGFWAAIKFTSGTGMVIDDTAKTATKSAAGWSVDQWAGYWLPYNGYIYYIKSNTATVLTLSDPDSTLAAGTTAYAIVKWFRVNSNTSTVLYLDDDDGELVAGTYDYYLDFIECIVQKPEMKYTQTRYYYQQETWKNNFQIAFEEI